MAARQAWGIPDVFSRKPPSCSRWSPWPALQGWTGELQA
jgi:hypothetical protein